MNARNFHGETALYLACKESQYELAALLIKHNANLNLPNNEDVTPLHVAINNVLLAHLLIKNGAKLNAQDYSGETPLHEAVEAKNLEVVCMLLYYNVDANIHCFNNLTPLMKAIIREYDDIQAALIDYVVDFNDSTNDGMSLLMLALTHSTPFVKEIIDGGANVNYIRSSREEFFQFDMLEMCLRVPNVDNFRLVWPKYHSQLHDLLGSVMFRMNESILTDSPLYKGYLMVVMENVEQAVASATRLDFGDIIKTCHQDEWISLDFLTQFAITLLQHGYRVCTADYDTVLRKYGYCNLYKFMLHIQPNPIRCREFYFSRVLLDVNKETDEIFREYIAKFDRYTYYTGASFLLTTKYFVLPNAYKFILSYRDELEHYEAMSERVKVLPKLPLLLDLARNKARDHIIKRGNIANSSQYLTYVDRLPIASIYKKILTFEKQLYY